MTRIGVAADEAARQMCFDIRRTVFIEEQQIPEAEEWDHHDETCTHVLAQDDLSAPTGTARIIAKGRHAKIGRVAVLPAYRGGGLGRALMAFCLDCARERGFAAAELESQVYAISFYEGLGFIAEGPEYDDGSGILHRRMTRPL
ncbi:GNAT family acetyltransferase YjcF [Roseibacterium elongatum DSM 19469]|uniref:GNAT family acetyltransferase YjcF n=1 Tax=Roseicyclus elongatus DSM 19469 TaxID=1294273 RepID=W8RQ50_9RHOB|nr:GNAT family N-acetyltransferase [Roseibacterium elongatum]AHM03299.1 GNAT family acetyltransferase YjcF [Roseibacterium elongatum DSM 19469]